jgi:Nucleotidyl transferase AbiEii toxin, Type IV TA system
MDPFHERLARVALDVAASYGFALAGGYAVQAHGFLDRPSTDVDLFAEASAHFDFSQAVDAVIAAYRRDGLEADAEVRSSTFARLSVSSGEERAKVELGVDWRKNEPILLAVGPVLHADDAVANKVCALAGRRYAITSTWPPSWRAAATPKRTWSALRKNTIRASTRHGSPKPSARWTACRTRSSRPTVSARRTCLPSRPRCAPGRRRSAAANAGRQLPLPIAIGLDQ